jgi:hypothetical protein
MRDGDLLTVNPLGAILGAPDETKLVVPDLSVEVATVP